MYGSTEYLGTLTLPVIIASWLSGSCGLVSRDSKMELERPGEEKNRRWEAHMVAKSGAGESVSSESISEEEKKSAVLE